MRELTSENLRVQSEQSRRTNRTRASQRVDFTFTLGRGAILICFPSQRKVKSAGRLDSNTFAGEFNVSQNI